MNLLTDLRAALEAKEEAASALDMLSKPSTSGFDEISWKRAYYRLKHLEDDLHRLLTDDTIRALLDVAEAAEREVEASEYEWHTPTGLIAALAPLVKEANDE
ncbi:MAG: hypothetical protein RBR38_15045 [Desulfomicrobium apsheronum]|nr:hypothetical protein [Desulfomicrobium apsheronum]